jgi:hypothetical protein
MSRSRWQGSKTRSIEQRFERSKKDGKGRVKCHQAKEEKRTGTPSRHGSSEERAWEVKARGVNEGKKRESVVRLTSEGHDKVRNREGESTLMKLMGSACASFEGD